MGGSPPAIPFFQVSAPLQDLPAFIHSPVPSDCSVHLFCFVVQSLELFPARGSDPVQLTQSFHGNHQIGEEREMCYRFQEGFVVETEKLIKNLYGNSNGCQ